MTTKTVEVRQTLNITVDETKFTEEWMEEFRSYMYRFRTLDEHIMHIAQCAARFDMNENDFLEGYGILKDMGIKIKFIDQEEEIMED